MTLMIYLKLLLPNYQDKIARITLEQFVSSAQATVSATPAIKEHLAYFYDRYLDFKKVDEILSTF